MVDTVIGKVMVEMRNKAMGNNNIFHNNYFLKKDSRNSKRKALTQLKEK